MSWQREHDYDAIVAAAAREYSVSPALIKAVIAHESGFNPRARRVEPSRTSLPPTPDFPEGGDESRGLMQLLVRTARGLGYDGPIYGLYDPGVNIDLGARLLGDQVRAAQRRGYGIEAALSAYNGGYRPSLGFGAPLPDGEFGNQAYVDVIMHNLKYFEAQESPAAGGSSSGGSSPGESGGSDRVGLVAPYLIVLLTVIGLVLLLIIGRGA